MINGEIFMKFKNKVIVFFIVIAFLGLVLFGASSGYLVLNTENLEYTYTVGAILPLTGNA